MASTEFPCGGEDACLASTEFPCGGEDACFDKAAWNKTQIMLTVMNFAVILPSAQVQFVPFFEGTAPATEVTHKDLKNNFITIIILSSENHRWHGNVKKNKPAAGKTL